MTMPVPVAIDIEKPIAFTAVNMDRIKEYKIIDLLKPILKRVTSFTEQEQFKHASAL
jgi:hypothetical protein